MKKISLVLLLSCVAVHSEFVVAAAAQKSEDLTLVPLALPVLGAASFGANRIGSVARAACGSTEMGQLALNGLALTGAGALGAHVYQNIGTPNKLTRAAASVGFDSPVLVNGGLTTAAIFSARKLSQNLLGVTTEQSIDFYRNVCIGAGALLAVNAGYQAVSKKVIDFLMKKNLEKKTFQPSVNFEEVSDTENSLQDKTESAHQ